MANIESQGMTIRRGDGGGPETFTTIPQVVSIDGPSGSASEIAVSNLSSTAQEFIMGLPDEGEISLEINYDPDDLQHLGLQSDRDARTARNFEMHFTDATPSIWSFTGYVTGFSVSAAVDDVVKASCTIRLTGAVTRA